MRQQYIGERFGDYTLVLSLGEGGFASVYLGQEVHDGTFAAIKLPKEQQVHNFINELRRTILLQHPNIVKVRDFGIRTPDNTAFIIMEYAPNGSFREKYPKGTRVPLDVVVTAVKQVASALQYAHDQRVIHRDVKPENLLLNARNMVLLSDFGIATASRTVMKSNAGQAEKDDVGGTYEYMAPEQLRGRPVPASDQYSLAIMVYEWLCGELPFEAPGYIQWRHEHEKTPPPSLLDHIPSLPPAVEQVILRALAKKPEERFERVETFALALERAARREGVPSVVLPGMGTSERNIHPRQFDSTPAGRQGNVFVQPPSNSIEQLFQEGVRARSNRNAEEEFRIWRQLTTTAGVAEHYSTTALNRIRELRTQMIPLRLKQAREASMQGRYQEEIGLWEDMLALETSAKDLESLLKSPLTLGTNGRYYAIEERLQIARQNEKFAFMYTGAQQSIRNKDNASARTQLQMLWHDAPYFGDPSGLSKVLGLPAVQNYEQAIAAEQARLEQKRKEQERREREWQEQEQRVRDRRRLIDSILVIIMGALVISGITGAVVAIVAGAGEAVEGAVAGAIIGAIAGVILGVAGAWVGAGGGLWAGVVVGGTWIGTVGAWVGAVVGIVVGGLLGAGVVEAVETADGIGWAIAIGLAVVGAVVGGILVVGGLLGAIAGTGVGLIVGAGGAVGAVVVKIRRRKSYSSRYRDS